MPVENVSSLPFPSLENSIFNFKKTVFPLLTPSENEEFGTLCQQFIESDGALLHKRFKQAECGKNNWMADAWDEMYLSIREPLYSDSNYCIHLANKNNGASRISFIAQWIRKVAQFYLNNHKEHRDSLEINGAAFCNRNANRIFGAYRKPAKLADIWQNFSEQLIRTISISYNGSLYSIKVISKQQSIIEQKALENLIHFILESKAEVNTLDFTKISLLGSEATADFLTDFLMPSSNSESYQAMTEVICHISLQDDEYASGEQVCNVGILGKNRVLWPYTPVNFICWSNNQISAFMEHTSSDATGMLSNIEQIHLTESEEITNYLGNLHVCRFTYSSKQRAILDQIKTPINANKWSVEVLDESVELADFNISVDTFVQLMLQYAAYNVEGKFKSIYAPASMGHFVRGRTETLRALSIESQKFIINAMETQNIDRKLLEFAAGKYKEEIKIAKSGHGFSRHLFMLKRFMDDNQVASSFFSHKSFELLNENYISTSNLGKIGDTCEHFLFLPPNPSTFGVGYLTDKDKIRLHLTYANSNQEKAEYLTHAIKTFIMLFKK